jgi:hypothetical protein
MEDELWRWVTGRRRAIALPLKKMPRSMLWRGDRSDLTRVIGPEG